MTDIYTRLAASATRMIAQYGQIVTWKQLNEGTPTDTTKPWKEGGFTAVTYNVKMLFLPNNRLFFESEHLIRMDNSRDEFDTQVAGQEQGYLAVQSFTPKVKDVVIRDNKEYRIQSLNLYKPATIVLLWIVEFEK